MTASPLTAPALARSRRDGGLCPRHAWLTLPVSAWCIAVAAIAGLYECFDSCGPTDSLLNPIAVAEFLLGATTVLTLVLGLAVPKWRRKLRWVIWIACGPELARRCCDPALGWLP